VKYLCGRQTNSESPHLSAYTAYTDHEIEEGDPVRVLCIFERAIVDNCLQSDLWIRYVNYVVYICTLCFFLLWPANFRNDTELPIVDSCYINVGCSYFVELLLKIKYAAFDQSGCVQLWQKVVRCSSFPMCVGKCFFSLLLENLYIPTYNQNFIFKTRRI